MKHPSKQMPKLTEEDVIAKLRAYADDQCSNKISPEFAYATLVLLEEKDWMIAGLKDDIVIYKHNAEANDSNKDETIADLRRRLDIIQRFTAEKE